VRVDVTREKSAASFGAMKSLTLAALLPLLPLGAATAHASDPTLGGLASAPRTTESRPWAIVLDNGFGAPTGLMGLTLSYQESPELAASVGFGFGMTGWQLAILGRWSHPIGASRSHSWVVGFGPSLALRGENLGKWNIEHRDDIVVEPDDVFYTVWLNVDVGWEYRAQWGGLFRLVLGAGLRLADNQRHLCEGVETGDSQPESSCNPPHFGPGSIYTRTPVLPYLAFSYGYAF